MSSIKNKMVVLALLVSVFTVPCTKACGTCAKPPPPPPSKTAACPPPPGGGGGTDTCSLDVLKLGVCTDLLGLVGAIVGSPPSGSKCCALLNGLADLEAAVCLCTAIKANVLGIQLDVPVALSVLLSGCQKTLPSGFTCKS